MVRCGFRDMPDFELDGLRPQTIYTPRDANELAENLAECNRLKCAVIPWGGGTLQHLGNVPARLDAVIDTTRLNQVLEYAYDDLTITVQAGMTLSQIDRVLGEHGQFLPIDIPLPDHATIGGVLATGVNGGLRLRYGPARDFMIGNRFATVEGKVIKAGSKVVKNVAGYELHKLMVGSFGTLGILTEATFKIFPKPTEERWLLAGFGQLPDACAAVRHFWNLSVPPLALTLFDDKVARMAHPGVNGQWMVIARYGGTSAVVKAADDLYARAARDAGGQSVETNSEVGSLWRTVADLPATLAQAYPNALIVRGSVPPKDLETLVRLLHNTAAKHNLAAPVLFAHAASVVAYAAFEGDDAPLAHVVSTLRSELHELHGHLVIEHASAAVRTRLNAWNEVGPGFKLMQAIKKQFDPNNILNPGRFVGGI